MLVSILRSNNRSYVHRLGYARMLSGRSNAFLMIIGLVLLVTGTREEINLLTLIAIGPPALCHMDLVTYQKVVFLIIIDDHPINLAHTVVELPLLHDISRSGFVHGPPVDINLLSLKVAFKVVGLLSSP